MAYFLPFKEGMNVLASSRAIGRDVSKLAELVKMGLGIEISVEHLDVYHRLPFTPYVVHLPYGDVLLTHPDEKIRERSIQRVKAEMIKAREKGARLTVLHIEPGCEVAPKIPLTQKIENFQQAMHEILSLAKRLSLALALENNGYSKDSFASPEELLALIIPLKEKYSELGLCFDTGHAHVYACEMQMELEEIFNALKEYIIHIHLHENDGTEDKHATPIGRFPLSFYRQLFSLKGISVTLEINPEFGLDGVRKGYVFVQKIKKEVGE